MKLSPFQLYIRSLAHGPVKLGYLEKEEAYKQLKAITGEDFGFDVDRWREWGRDHPEVSQGM